MFSSLNFMSRISDSSTESSLSVMSWSSGPPLSSLHPFPASPSSRISFKCDGNVCSKIVDHRELLITTKYHKDMEERYVNTTPKTGPSVVRCPIAMDDHTQPVAFVTWKDVCQRCEEPVIFGRRHHTDRCQIGPCNHAVILRASHFLSEAKRKENIWWLWGKKSCGVNRKKLKCQFNSSLINLSLITLCFLQSKVKITNQHIC